ncbi:MAG: 30S ribosomal protein S17 [Dehalococcoidia bacterium]|nr:30S ribosomal protein S17 [Dehalococcoidia bacterium]
MVNQEKTGRRRQQTGKVLSARNIQTIIVGVEWSLRHLLYKKSIRRLTKYVAHDEKSEAKLGDTVLIEETRPLSATKRWRLIQVVQKGELSDLSPDAAAAAVPQEAATR